MFIDASLIKVHNKLKKDLEAKQRKLSFIETLGAFWEKERKTIKEELNTALVKLVWRPRQIPYSEPAFSSASERKALGRGTSFKIETKIKEKRVNLKEQSGFFIAM